MVKLVAYNPEMDTFIELTRPVDTSRYEYEVYFNIFNQTTGTLNAQHYVYCKDINALTRVLEKLGAILNNPNVKSHYTYLAQGREK